MEQVLSKRADYKSILKRYLENEEILLKALFNRQRRGTDFKWIKIELRPVIIKGVKHIQFAYYDTRKCIVKNYKGEEYKEKIKELVELPFKNISIETENKKLQIQFSKKDKLIIHESGTDSKRNLSMDHNREKKHILSDDNGNTLLQALGIMDQDGKVIPAKRDKFKQINRFLEIVDGTVSKSDFLKVNSNKQLSGIDCGCGNAYLTFAFFYYFNSILKIPLKLTGIDTNEELLNAHKEMAKEQKWDGLDFEIKKIIDYMPSNSPDLVLALHACDTATDEALFQAIKWQSRFIFCSPCCHHYLQVQIDGNKKNLMQYKPILHYGILRERLGDILTDAFRALILRIMGYKVDLIEFVSLEHTNRNILIRAEKKLKAGNRKLVKEYMEMRGNWHVTPFLETLLGNDLTKYLDQLI